MEESRNWNFARLFVDIFEAKNMNFTTLANAVGCSTKTLTRICNDEQIPSKKLVIALGVALGLTLNEICLFLYYAGYTLSVALKIDKNYIQAIKNTEGMSGAKRIIDCNTILSDNKIEEKDWLFKYQKKKEKS